MALPVRIKEEVWRRANGDKVNGTCFCCSTQITSFSFDAGHVVARSKGGADTVDNLRPICSSCNSSMGTQNLLDYKLKYFSGGTSKFNPTPSVLPSNSRDSEKLLLSKFITEEKKRREKEISSLEKDLLKNKEIQEVLELKLKALKIESEEKLTKIEDLKKPFCENLINGDSLCGKYNCQIHVKSLIDFDIDEPLSESRESSGTDISSKDESKKKKKPLRQYVKEFVSEMSSPNGVKINVSGVRKMLKDYITEKGDTFSSGHLSKTTDDELGGDYEFLWCIGDCKKPPHYEVGYPNLLINPEKIPAIYHQFKEATSKEDHKKMLEKYGTVESRMNKMEI